MSARHDRARPAVKARGDDSGQTRGGRSCALCIIVSWVVVFVFLWHPSPYTLAPPAAAAAAGAPVTFADLFEGDDVDVAGAAQARWIAHAAAETDAPTPRGRARKTHAAPRASAAARPPRPCAPRGLALDDGFGVSHMVGLQLPSGETVDGVHPKSPCEAKAECRRRGPVACAAFVWSPAWSSAVFVRRTDAAALVSGASAGEGPQVLYVALSAGADSVARALAAFDAAPRFQRTSSASIVARQAQWAARGGGPPKFWDETVSHGWYAEAKHETTAFDVYAISHEAWVQQPTQKLLEIYDGPCAAKSKCASMPNCDGFAMRHRDGTALLYAKLQIRSPEDKATSRALERFASKFRRVTWLYVRVRSDGRRSTAVPTAPASLEGTPPPRYDGQVCFGSGAASGLAAAPPAFELERVGDAQLRLHELEADAALAPQVAARNRTRLIVSLTTLPGRIEQIRPVLETLLSQTLAPDEIIVAVPLKASRLGETRVPPWLAAMPRVRVLRPEMDFGPATKLVAALRESLDRAAAARLRGDLEGEVFELATRIVVVDDDTLYSPRLVESLAAWAARLPEAAVATTGWPVASGLRYPHWTQNYLVYGNELYAPHRVAVVRGNCGFLVRPSFFKPALWEDMAGAPRGAVLMDDVWISGMLARSGVSRFVVPLDAETLTRSPNFKDVVTLDSNLGHGVTDRQQANEAALKHFGKQWDVFWAPPTPSLLPHKRSS